MDCVTASGTPDSSRRHPEATHKVFSWTRSCEPAAQHLPDSLKYINSRAGEKYDEYITDEKTTPNTGLLFTRWTIFLFSALTRKACGSKLSFPVTGRKLLSPKDANETAKKL